VVLNTIQSLFASLPGSIYVFSSSKPSSGRVTIFPTHAIIAPLLLISIPSSLASPFGYASLAHVDYLTFVLAKSCKLKCVSGPKVDARGHDSPPSLAFSVESSLGRSDDAGYD
jgi:hypothetical protein